MNRTYNLADVADVRGFHGHRLVHSLCGDHVKCYQQYINMGQCSSA